MFLYKRSTEGGRRLQDRQQSPWVAVFTSVWHGITKDGKIQLDLLSRQRPWKSCERVYAIHGPSLSLEMTLWESLNHTDSVSEPLLSALIAPPANQRPHKKCSTAEEIIQRFHLNEDQTSAVKSLLPWLEGSGKGCDCPIRLIHGPFGTGKSSLLVAMIHVLTSGHDEDGTPLRLLMCAHTNKAVDRIMEGLMESGFTDFIRVGLVSKISRPVLPHSLYYASETDENSSAASELKRQLQFPMTVEEETILRNELDQVERGAIQKRREKLESARVVGVTCCSANSTVLQGQTFDVVILDEACQIIEPLSILPLIKSEAKFLIAAGDPRQLPAVAAHPTDPASGHGLIRPLFSRLQQLGHQPFMLRTQYRCHPDLSRVPNQCFYNDQLLDGCSRTERLAVVADWPALCHFQVSGTAVRLEATGSYENREEAGAVVKLVTTLISKGVENAHIGVICFFRAQVSCIQSLLPEKLQSLQVATVDSFQGMEKQVIVLSMTVSQPGAFASDEQRLNVAMTRARNHLIVVGDKVVLSAISPCMKALLKDATTLSLGR